MKMNKLVVAKDVEQTIRDICDNHPYAANKSRAFVNQSVMAFITTRKSQDITTLQFEWLSGLDLRLFFTEDDEEIYMCY